MKRVPKYTIVLLVVIMLIPMTANAQTIKRSKQKPKTEKTQKQNKSNSNSTKQNTNPQKQNNNTRNEKVKQGANTTIEISISSNASDASVYIDGVYYGAVGRLYEVSPGSHKLMIVANGYETHESTIYVSPSNTSFNCHLNETTFIVTFKCDVSYANLSIDGTVVGFANGQYSLSPGSHSIKISYTGYEDKTDYISVYSDASYNYKLVPIKNTNNDSQSKTKAKTVTVNGVSFEMIFVDGGTFMMGATVEQGRDARTNEHPIHDVTLSNYYIGKFEVTQELWLAVMGNNPSYFAGDMRRPVEMVSWYDCQKFIAKLNSLTGINFRLPTEAEWEYAARGGKRSMCYRYAGGNNLDTVAWYYGNSAEKTHPVGQKAPNELGLHDMSGNVYEWCQDRYSDYSRNTQTNPIGASEGTDCVWRGGCWGHREGDCRISARNYYDPSRKYAYHGLRLAASSL